MANGLKGDYSRYKDFFLNILRVYKNRSDVKTFLELILSLTTILIFVIFAIRPTILTIIELNKEIKEKEEVVLKIKQKIKNLQIASTTLQQKSADIPYITQAVPQRAEIETIVGQIQGYAVNSGVTILSLSSSDVVLIGKDKTKKSNEVVTLPQNAREVPITISVTGNFSNLFSFLKSIEGLRRPIQMDSFVINSSLTETGKVLVMVITGRLPYLNGE